MQLLSRVVIGVLSRCFLHRGRRWRLAPNQTRDAHGGSYRGNKQHRSWVHPNVGAVVCVGVCA
jgi:hypothetical protein